MSADFWAGYISGAIGIVIGNPLDLLKVRLQAVSSVPRSSGPRPYGPHGARLPLTQTFTSAATLIAGTAAPILGYGALNALLFVSYNRSEAWLTRVFEGRPMSEDGARSFNPGQNLMATWVGGAIGGLATWAISTPTELIKCRVQMAASQGTPTLSSWGVAREVIRQEGLRGIYFGGVVTALRDSIGYGFYFWSYELLNRWTSRYESVTSLSGGGDSSSNALGWVNSDATKVLLCGGIAGIVTWASIFPLDVIKTRVQTQAFGNISSIASAEENTTLLNQNNSSRKAGRRGAWEIAKLTYREEGMRSFFRGLGVCSVRAFIVNAVQWATYEWIMRELGQGRERTRTTTIVGDME